MFRVGVMESLTGPGVTYGTVATLAKQMAMEEINAAGGINGRMLELVVEDSKCSGQAAIAAYNKLTDVGGVKIILGTSCSAAMLGAAPLAEEDGVVLFSALATDLDIADAGDYIFRTAMSDAHLGIDMGNLLWADGVRTLVTISETTHYAEGVTRRSVAQFLKRGGEVVAEERFPSDTADFRGHLANLVIENPDALHVAANAEFAAGTIVKQARKLGFAGPIYSDVVAVGTAALDIAGNSATGLKALILDLDPSNNKARQVLKNFGEKSGYGALPWHPLPWYLGSAYDSVYITTECLRKTNDDQDTDGFRDCLYDITWTGAIGDNYGFDANGEVVGVSNLVVEVLPISERTQENNGYRVLGGAPLDTTVRAEGSPERAPAPSPVLSEPSAGGKQYDGPPAMTIDPEKSYFAIFEMEEGDKFTVELYAKEAPITVNSFVFLARDGFYDGVTFHRVIEGFVAQGGDPTGTGTGGPGYSFENEVSPKHRHDAAGVLSMANAGGGATNGSQFFITFVPLPFLDGYEADGTPKNCAQPAVSCHTVFGRVIKGMDVVNAISLRDPATATTPGDAIRTITITEE